MHLPRLSGIAVASLLVSTAVSAQMPAIQRSQTSGLQLGGQIGTSLLSAERTSANPGYGGGLFAAYGLTPRLQLFANADAQIVRVTRDQFGNFGRFDVSNGEDAGLVATRQVGLSESIASPSASMTRDVAPYEFNFNRGNNNIYYADIGARYMFANDQRAWVPYVSTAATFRRARVPVVGGGGTFSLTSQTITVGGGTQYFLSRARALDLGFLTTIGDANPADSRNIGTDELVLTTRISVGIRNYIGGNR